MKVRVAYKSDGKVSVIYPAPKSKRLDETEEEWLERVFTKAMKQDVELEKAPYDDINETELPQDRTYRDLWRGKKGGNIRVALEELPAYQESQKTPEQQEIEFLKSELVRLEGLIEKN